MKSRSDKMTDVKKLVGQVFEEIADGIETGAFGKKVVVGVTTIGSEHGAENVIKGAELAQRKDPSMKVVLIGPKVDSELTQYEANSADEAAEVMEKLLDSGEIDSCVTMHYSFPIGVSTVGRVVTPAFAEEMYIATTTGTSSTNRIEGMVLNGIYGIIAATAAGIENPKVGILNVDGANQVERAFKKLKDNGLNFEFAESNRADGGVLMRGNDVIQGVPDVLVTDSLTGNILMKVFGSFNTGGGFEANGYGYGPGVGEGYDRTVLIISRASGYPVIANAIAYGADVAKGNINKVNADTFAAAKKAGLDAVREGILASDKKASEPKEEIKMPEKEVTDYEMHGIDILELEDAVQTLWAKDIYASSGMGCTGPVIMINTSKYEAAHEILLEAGYLAE